ncbi:MAG: hypothetical protein QOD38_1635, partial [Acidimicrobiaceae bacterium]
ATFVPEELLGTDDSRRLGVPLTLITTKPRHRGPHQRPRSFVDSYTKIVANAAFTQGFIDRWWNVESTVVYPPVSMREAGTKKNTILSVGRFFAAEHGHSKKQLEMVRAFRRLCDRGLKRWELHLVGGCASDGQAYLQAVQSAAAGLPVVMHPNASGAELHELYASASIFWSFTGLGEHPRRDPARFEHFGITTVEAMSAGAVPIVLRAGGQVEIVRPEIEGLLFDDIGSVVKATWRVASNDELRARLSIGARERAKHFDMTRFTERFQAVVEEAVAAER